MTTLSALLATTKAILQAHSLCSNVRVMETREFSARQFFFKLRADLPEEYNLQVRLYYNQGHLDYAYQLFTQYPLLRWDNKEEFPDLDTYPHHHHDVHGNIITSPLVGDPVNDLDVVLAEITKYLSDRF